MPAANRSLCSLVKAALVGLIAIPLSACVETAPRGTAVTASGEKRSPSQMLQVGDVAPPFSVQDETGTARNLADYRGNQNVVLIFYPGNETPGCTRQLCSARDDWKKYEETNTIVFGVNPASAESHRKFKENHDFPFPLLADTDGSMVRNYGCFGPMGVTTRTVYVIDKEGRIIFAERGMPATETILAAVAQ